MCPALSMTPYNPPKSVWMSTWCFNCKRLVLSLVNEICKFLDGKEHVSGLYLDLTNTFQVVKQSLRLSKIESVGTSNSLYSYVTL